jgi:hypothetical protein
MQQLLVYLSRLPQSVKREDDDGEHRPGHGKQGK